MRFKNKVCLVTGGGSGIGRATCFQLAAEGGRVLVIDQNANCGLEVVELIRGKGASLNSPRPILPNRNRSKPPWSRP